MNKDFAKLPPRETIERTIAALTANGMDAVLAESGADAKQKALALIPAGTEVMNMTSVTLETTGIAREILESGRFASVRNLLNTMNRKTQGAEMQKLGAAPAWTIGSVHAITETGEVLIASNTGSQLPAYAYGAGRVIWVAGAQKIVRDREEGFRRIYEYVLPLESERAKQAYGVPGSFVSKLLIVNREVQHGRITIIIVNEALGF